MASPRNKSAAKSKSARPADRHKPAKKSAPARGKTATKKVVTAKSKPVKPAAAAKHPSTPKPAAAAKHAPAAKHGATPKPAVVAKQTPAAKAAAAVRVVKAVKPGMIVKPQAGKAGALKGRHGLSPRKGSAPEQVRPIGMLPPESLARPTHRAAPRPVMKPSPKPAIVRPQPETNRPEGSQRVTEKDLKEFEDRLLHERRRILKEMGHLETNVLKVNQRDSAGDLSGYSFHMADAGTDAMEREKAFLFASAEGRVLLEIDDALRRLYRGEYGSCETCGNAIARARLEVMPQARLCISCKEKEERAQRGAM